MFTRFSRRGRVTVFLLSAALAVTLVTGSATPRTTYIITDGDVVTTVEGYAGELDGLLFSDIQSHKGQVVVYGAGPAFRELRWGAEHAYEGTIAQDIERFGLRSLTVEDTLDSIKSIDWVLFAPHGIRSYFAKPFYTEQGLHAILILASLRPGSFGADAETRFASLMGPFERLIGAWRKG